MSLCPQTPCFRSDFELSLLDESLTIPMLVDLMKKHKPSVQAACLGAMQNLSLTIAFHRKLLERGVLEALDSSKDVDGGALGAQCAAILYNFSLHEKSITQMIELGGIFLVTHLSYSNNIKVRSTLSYPFMLADDRCVEERFAVCDKCHTGADRKRYRCPYCTMKKAHCLLRSS